MPIHELKNGELFDSKYRVEESLGQGGMAVVYRVTEAGEVDTEHALKLIKLPSFPSEAALATAKQRFRQEAATQARVRHPHIVGVHRYDVTACGTPYLLMELLDGQDLAGVLKRVGRIPWPAALLIIEQAALALAMLHAAGFIHRDLSPEIFLVRQGSLVPEEAPFVKLLDFGIAKSAKAQESSLTDPSLRIGNPPYMAPECILKRPRRPDASGDLVESEIDGRADEFSLACILFEMLAGYKAFLPDGGDPAQAFGLVLNSDPLDSALPPIFTPSLKAVLGRALSKDPAARFPTVADFVAALRRLDPAHELGSTPSAADDLTVRFDQLAADARPEKDGDAAPRTGSPALPPGDDKYVHLSLSTRTLYWTGIVAVVCGLGVFAFRQELALLGSRLPVNRAPVIAHIEIGPQGDSVTPARDLGRAVAARDAGFAAVASPDLGPVTRAAAVRDLGAPPPPPEPSKPSVRPTTPRRTPVPPRTPQHYEFDYSEKGLPVQKTLEDVLTACLKRQRAWKRIDVILIGRILYASGLTDAAANQDFSNCVNRKLPPGKQLPKKTWIRSN